MKPPEGLLTRAVMVLAKAESQGFRWPNLEAASRKVAEELEEVAEAAAVSIQAGQDQPSAQVVDEVGDLLLAALSLSRFLGCDADQALAGAIAKFERRFALVEARLRREQVPVVNNSATLARWWAEAKEASQR